MLRTPLTRALSLGSPTRAIALAVQRTSTSVAKAPEKIEVFVDDKSVFVDPGTTVLQASEQESENKVEFNCNVFVVNF